MEYRKLGRSALEISRIGFGCMSLQPDNPDNFKIIDHAIEAGINYFDTADLYDKGANEEFLGKALKQKRKQVILATKAGNQWRKDGSGWDWNPKKEYILQCADDSLRRLSTDYIDLFQLHGGTIDDPIDETIEAFEILVKQGKIRHYGISSIRPNVIREWVAKSGIVSVMMQYSLLDRRPEETCLSLLAENQIGVVTRGSLAQGLLVGKAPKPYLDRSEEEVKKAVNAVKSLVGRQRTATDIACRYVLHHPAITSAVIGIRTMEQLKEAISVIDSPVLSGNDYKILQAATSLNFYTDHR